jgi:hypothetical protein
MKILKVLSEGIPKGGLQVSAKLIIVGPGYSSFQTFSMDNLADPAWSSIKPASLVSFLPM